MASLRRHRNSPFWYACYSVPIERDGCARLERFQESTKETDRRKAQKTADALEAAGRRKLPPAQARKLFAELYQLVSNEALPSSTVRAFFNDWKENKVRETASTTAAKYKNAVAQFLNSLGKRADTDITMISSADITAFRDERAKRVSASTANLAVKIIRMALKDAIGQNLITTNPAASVRPAKSGGAAETRAARRPFSVPELQRVLAHADGEWRGLILFGLYTGQRLGDIASLTWQNVELARGEISMVSRKTGRRVLIPIAEPLQRFIEEDLATTDNPRASLFPKAAGVKGTGTLSNQFHEILADAGLVLRRKHTKRASGRDSRRESSELSFHALRHTATSLMKNAGVTPAVVQDLIGHESAAVSAHYTHIDEPTKRAAIAKLPDLSRQ